MQTITSYIDVDTSVLTKIFEEVTRKGFLNIKDIYLEAEDMVEQLYYFPSDSYVEKKVGVNRNMALRVRRAVNEGYFQALFDYLKSPVITYYNNKNQEVTISPRLSSVVTLRVDSELIHNLIQDKVLPSDILEWYKDRYEEKPDVFEIDYIKYPDQSVYKPHCILLSRHK